MRVVGPELASLSWACPKGLFLVTELDVLQDLGI